MTKTEAVLGLEYEVSRETERKSGERAKKRTVITSVEPGHL
jgi:hypothetical protein